MSETTRGHWTDAAPERPRTHSDARGPTARDRDGHPTGGGADGRWRCSTSLASAWLDDRPVAEHVAVFEQAHERLRRALDPGHG